MRARLAKPRLPRLVRQKYRKPPSMFPLLASNQRLVVSNLEDVSASLENGSIRPLDLPFYGSLGSIIVTSLELTYTFEAIPSMYEIHNNE